MNEQEMQFAEPDWKPTESAPLEQGHRFEDASAPDLIYFSHDEAKSHAEELTYEQGYRGQSRSESISAQSQAQTVSMDVTRRRSRWWMWVVILIVFASAIAGIAGAGGRPLAHFGDLGRPFMGNLAPGSQVYTYALGEISQVAIVSSSGSITVRVADTNSAEIVVQTSGLRPEVHSGAYRLLIESNANLVVTLPRNLALALSTSSGNIEVDGFSGQLSARTVSGAITLNDNALSGLSRIRTEGSGAINFTGLLDPSGAYQFSSEMGNIDLTLPAHTAMHIRHFQENGSYHSDFPVSTRDFPRALLFIISRQGNIALHQP